MRQTLILIVTSILILTGCASSGGGFDSLPAGDAARGEAIYSESIHGAPACSSCHSLTDETLIGSGFAGYSDIAATRIEGQSAADYTYNAIIRPAVYIVDGYANLMYSEFRSKLSEQDTADLIAFLLTQ